MTQAVSAFDTGLTLLVGGRATLPAQRRLAALLLACALVVGRHAVAAAQTDSLVINVDAAQRATVVGRTLSLRTVIEELCWRAGIALDFYDAVDRPAAGTFRDLPVGKVLGRLLSQESYVAGTTTDPSTGNERVSWLRVLGEPTTAMARRASGAGPTSAIPLQVPPDLLLTALAAPRKTNPSEQQTALAVIEARIAGDPRELEAFLTTDSRLIAEAIVRFDRASESLREARSHYSDPRITAKLDDVIAALSTMNSHRQGSN